MIRICRWAALMFVILVAASPAPAVRAETIVASADLAWLDALIGQREGLRHWAACEPTGTDPQGECMRTCWTFFIRCQNGGSSSVHQCEADMSSCSKRCGC